MNEHLQLLILKGQLTELDAADQAIVQTAAEKIRTLVRDNPVATFALAQVALEVQTDPKAFGLPS